MDSIGSGELRTVRLLVADLHGVARAKQVSADYFVKILSSGHAWATPFLAADLFQEFDLSLTVGLDNGFLLPDLGTFAALPWNPSVAYVVCDFMAKGTYGPAPRHALRRVEADLQGLGYTALLGNELEFYVYRDEVGDMSNGIGMRAWASNYALAGVAAFVDDLHAFLPRLGIPVYEVFSEHGAGQFEINLSPSSPLASVDQVFVLRAAVKEIAALHGLKATYMSKPSNHEEVAPSGYHLHQSLHQIHGGNCFVSDGDLALSELGFQYLAGQLAHAPALTAFAAPTITAYKRFRLGTHAPLAATWSIEDRGPMLRTISAGEDTRIENRLGASDANPYLLAAAQLAAGMDGIQRGLKPPAAVLDPFEVPPGTALPNNLASATSALADDDLFTHRLGEELMRYYISMLRHVQHRFEGWVTDWELREYRDVL